MGKLFFSWPSDTLHWNAEPFVRGLNQYTDSLFYRGSELQLGVIKDPSPDKTSFLGHVRAYMDGRVGGEIGLNHHGSP